MLFADRLTLGKPRTTKEGYLAVRARSCRAGVYDYLGREIDPEGKHFAADAVVKVYRPENEVFAKDSVHSFLLKPITDNHPSKPVTAENWDGTAKGVNAGAMRDGEYLTFDLVIMDAKAIEQVQKGKRELSNGYSSEISIEDGEAPDGTHYDAIQRFIRGNHVAIVDKGRAGPECRIGDAVVCDSATVELLERLLGDERTYNGESGTGKTANIGTPGGSPDPSGGGNPVQDGEVIMPHTLIIDGLQVPNVSDEAKAAIEKLQGQAKDAADRADKAEAQVATLTTDKATLEAEKVTLEKKIADSKLSPQQLRDAAKSFQVVVDKAKALGVAVTDDMDEPAIMKAVVNAKLGDAAKDWSDVQVAASFATLSKDANAHQQPDPLRSALSSTSLQTKDAKAEYLDAREKHRTALSDAWRTPSPAAAD